MFVYKPDDISIWIGIPGVAGVEIRDWLRVTPSQPVPRFTITKGVLGEKGLRMSTDSSRTFTVTILQTSPDIEFLHNLYLAQLTGFLGFPFSIIDNGKDSGASTQRRQKSLYPVSVILNEREESFELEGAAWNYRIGVASGGTLYL